MSLVAFKTELDTQCIMIISDRDDQYLAYQDPSEDHFVEMPAVANMVFAIPGIV